MKVPLKVEIRVCVCRYQRLNGQAFQFSSPVWQRVCVRRYLSYTVSSSISGSASQAKPSCPFMSRGCCRWFRNPPLSKRWERGRMSACARMLRKKGSYRPEPFCDQRGRPWLRPVRELTVASTLAFHSVCVCVCFSFPGTFISLISQSLWNCLHVSQSCQWSRKSVYHFLVQHYAPISISLQHISLSNRRQITVRFFNDW